MSFVSEVVSSLTGTTPEVYDLVVVGSGFAVCPPCEARCKKDVLITSTGFHDHFEFPGRMQKAW
jgi:hypothetical protein